MPLFSVAGLSAIVALVAAWLTVMLLVMPEIGRGRFALRGFVGFQSDRLALFAVSELLHEAPSPSRLLEHLGPDRMRREFLIALRPDVDRYVDALMSRRNGVAWANMSAYARNRVYAYAHRRLPFIVDDFVENIQKDLDDVISPQQLIRRWFAANPQRAGELFMNAFGADLRDRLLLVALAGGLCGGLLAPLAVTPWGIAAISAVAAISGVLVLLFSLSWPRETVTIWPFRLRAITARRRNIFLRTLAQRIANEALSWQVISDEFLNGAQSSKVRMVVKRQVNGMLDVVFMKALLQIAMGPEGVLAVKKSAVEEALDVLARTSVSASLRENCRHEIERTLLHAAENCDPEAYRDFWRDCLHVAWKWLPAVMFFAGGGAGYVAGIFLVQLR